MGVRTSLSALAIGLVAGACATSPRASLVDSLVEIGLNRDNAVCLAGELDDRLERSELREVADFVGGLSAANSAGESLDALLSIDNPKIASSIASSSIACVFNR